MVGLGFELEEEEEDIGFWLVYALPVVVYCLISSFSIFFVDNELASRVRTRPRQRQRLRLLREVASQTSDTMSSEKKEDTKKVCVSLMLPSLSCYVTLFLSALLGVYVVGSRTKYKQQEKRGLMHSHYITLLLCVCLDIWRSICLLPLSLFFFCRVTLLVFVLMS